MAQIVKDLPAMQCRIMSLEGQFGPTLPLDALRPGFDSWVGTIPWKKEWQPTPVFWPGEFHGQSLAGYSPWGWKELDLALKVLISSRCMDNSP